MFEKQLFLHLDNNDDDFSDIVVIFLQEDSIWVRFAATPNL